MAKKFKVPPARSARPKFSAESTSPLGPARFYPSTGENPWFWVTVVVVVTVFAAMLYSGALDFGLSDRCVTAELKDPKLGEVQVASTTCLGEV